MTATLTEQATVPEDLAANIREYHQLATDTLRQFVQVLEVAKEVRDAVEVGAPEGDELGEVWFASARELGTDAANGYMQVIEILAREFSLMIGTWAPGADWVADQPVYVPGYEDAYQRIRDNAYEYEGGVERKLVDAAFNLLGMRGVDRGDLADTLSALSVAKMRAKYASD